MGVRLVRRLSCPADTRAPAEERRLRKVLAVVLAVPVVVFVYLTTAAHRTIAGRALIALVAGATIGLGFVALVPARETAATPPTTIQALPVAAFPNHVAVGVGLRDPVTVQFSKAMDAASVIGALRVEPSTAVNLTWDPSGLELTVQPLERWLPGTLHVVTVDRGALDLGGQVLAVPARSTFVTRPAVAGVVDATRLAGDRLTVDSKFSINFDAPVSVASAQAAFRIEPAIPGQLVSAGRRVGISQFTFVPATRLAPDTTYRVWFTDGLVDLEGAPVTTPLPLEARTVVAPSVVRFRPRAGTKGIERGVDVSVRFTTPMRRPETSAAFHVLVNGKEVRGTVSWAEQDTVLVFDPAKAFPYGAKVVARVEATALSKARAPLAEAIQAHFRIKAKPAAATARTTTTSTSVPSAGKAVGGGSWGAVETYYLRLMNCTRTGGWVSSGGNCSSPGGRDVAPLRLDPGISSKVARPYAKLLATRGICNHFIGGTPGDRLRRAGYTSYRWAENLGCRSGNPFSAVLGSHLYFQSEKNWSPDGGHYVNLMNAQYDRAGIGVWVSSGRVRLVVDFYHP
jgi:uncharacterized protein YkwD